MRLSKSGTATSALEVTNISQHGFWLFHDGQEYFLPYEDYPWFENATVSAICKVEDHGDGHFCWPDLDVDLSLEILQNPQRFPLVATEAGAVTRGSPLRAPKRGRPKKPSDKQM